MPSNQQVKILPLERTQEKNVFVMMRYRDMDSFKRIEESIRSTLSDYGLYARFAKDVRQADLLWSNITRYMDQCRYGIAIFDNLPRVPDESRLNPNVCTELGYMLSKGRERECLILKDEDLDLQTDLKGFLIEEFDGNRLDSLSGTVAKWVEQVVRALPLLQGLAMMLPGTKVANRINENAHEKLAIGSYIAEEYLPKYLGKGGLIIDSGTTAASVAEALLLSHTQFKSVDVFTNNLLASILLSSAKSLRCHLVPGIVDEDFAGVFGPASNEAISKVAATVTILACTSLTNDLGPCANSADNRSFKRAIIEKTNKTVIVVAGSRIGASSGSPVLESPDDWKRVLKENVDIIVTSPSSEAEALRTVIGHKVKIVDPMEMANKSLNRSGD
jgi:DeoR/GlpR family transcriptional regulator of sugar metabolism